MTLNLFQPRGRKPTKAQLRKGKDPQAELVQAWPQGCAVLLTNGHPHEGSTGRVRHPRAKDGGLRVDFPGMVLVDLDKPQGPIRNVYARPQNLRSCR